MPSSLSHGLARLPDAQLFEFVSHVYSSIRGLDSEPIRLELSAYVSAAVHLLGTFIRWFEFLNCLFAVAPVSYTNDSMTNLYQDSDEGGCNLEMPRVQARYAGKGHRALDETHEEVPPEAAQLYHQAGLQVVYAAQAHEERQWK